MRRFTPAEPTKFVIHLYGRDGRKLAEGPFVSAQSIPVRSSGQIRRFRLSHKKFGTIAKGLVRDRSDEHFADIMMDTCHVQPGYAIVLGEANVCIPEEVLDKIEAA